MSEHHGRMAGRSRIERELCNLMQHEQPELADLDNCGPRQVRRPFPSVHVSANDIGRRKVAQPIDDLRFSNVASVNDDIRSAQCANRLGTEELSLPQTQTADWCSRIG